MHLYRIAAPRLGAERRKPGTDSFEATRYLPVSAGFVMYQSENPTALYAEEFARDCFRQRYSPFPRQRKNQIQRPAIISHYFQAEPISDDLRGRLAVCSIRNVKYSS